MDRTPLRAFSFGVARGVVTVAIVGVVCAPRPAAAQQVVKVGTFTKSITTAGCPASCTNTVPHGLGVAPTALILWTDGGTTEGFAGNSFWWAFGVTDGTTSRSTAASSKNAVTTSSASRGSAAAALHIVEFGNVIRATATLQATPWDATNFYLQWTPNNASAYIIHFIAIGGTGVQAKVVEWQATGAGVFGNTCPANCVSVTGLPFQPTGVLNFMASDSAALPSTVADAAFTFGAMGGGRQWTNTFYSKNGVTTTATARAQRTDSALEEINSAGTETMRAQLVSMDPGGFTVDFTNNTVGPHRIFSLALAGITLSAGSFNRLGNVGCPAPCFQAVTGVGFKPTAVLFSSFMTTTQAAPITFARGGIGATDGTTQATTSINDDNAVTTTRATLTEHITNAFNTNDNNTGSLFARGEILIGAGHGSWDPDGFTVDWTTNSDNVATEILYLAFGPPPGPEFIESGTDATQGFQFFSTTSGAVTSSTALPATGPRSISADSTVGNAAAWVQYSGSMKGGAGAMGGRATAYFNFTAFPGATTSIMGYATTATTGRIDVRINTSGRLELWRMDAVPVQLATGSTLTLSTWSRIAFTNDGSANNWKVFLDGTQDISTTTGAATAGASSSMFLGWGQAPGASKVLYIDNIYDDNLSSQTDPGDIRVTSKLPAAVNANAFDTSIGTGAVNERPLSETNGKQHAGLTSVQQNYTLQAAGVGDADISAGATLIARSAWIWGKASSTSAITLQQNVSANASSVAFSGTTAGDLILVWAYNATAATNVTTAAGYTIVTGQAPVGSANAGSAAYKISPGGEVSSGTWTNATRIVVLIYRGVDQTVPIGASTLTSATSSNVITFPAKVMQRIDGSSWVVGVAGAKSATAGMNGTTTALTSNRTSQTTVAGLDTNGGVTSFAAQTLTVTTAGSWISLSIEIRAAASGAKIMDNGTETPVTMTAASAVYSVLTSSASYPSNVAGIGMRSSGTSADTFFYEGGTLIAFTPSAVTAATVTSLGATRYDRGVLVQWKTELEINNLGFHIDREISGRRTRVTRAIVAGSGLMAGQGTAVRGERRYAFWDLDAAAMDRTAVYFLEDVDFSGKITWHGPIVPIDGGLQTPPDIASSTSLRDVNKDPKRHGKIFRTEGTRLEDRWKPAHAQSAGAAQTVSTALDTQWALAAQPAVKIGVTHAGWYRVTQPELVAAGLDPRVDPRTLRLVTDGVEHALRVVGEADGRLDAGDAVEFYGTGLDTPFTDTHVYWLVAGTGPGQRIAVRERPAKGADHSAPSFWYTVQQKERSVFFAALVNGDAENWFGSVVSAEPVDVAVNAFHVDRAAGLPAELEITLQGITVDPTMSLNHDTAVVVNDVEVGAVVFAGQTLATQRIAVPVALLTEGLNTIRLTARGGEADYSLIDTVRLSYWHTYQADADLLAATAQGPGLVSFGGFASPTMRLVDISDPAAVEELSGVVSADSTGGSNISVRLTGSGPRQLFGFTDGTIATPAFVRANRPSQWHAASQAAAWVAVSPAQFASALDPLRAARAQQGLSTAVVDIENVYDEFSFGEKTPQALKDFVQRAGAVWKTAPRFLVLVGDATLDPRDYKGFGDADFVPIKQVPMAQVSLETASDDWFADADDDGVPELAVGRLSVRTALQARQMVAKILANETNDDGPWTKSVLLVADENDDVSNFERSAAALRTLVPADYTVRQVWRGPLGSEGARAALLDAVNQGQAIVNYVGHGSLRVWGHDGELLTAEDIRDTWRNAGRLPFVVAMNCLNGFFHDIYDESLAETFMLAPLGGAVAAWASSGLTSPGPQALVNQELFRLLFSRPDLTVGEAVAAAKRVISDRDVRRSWIFFGDPAMRLRGVAQPVVLSTIAPTPVVTGAALAPALQPTARPSDRATDAANDRVQLADFDGDGRADLVWYTPARGTWLALFSDVTKITAAIGQWGPGWQVSTLRLNGDAPADLFFYRPATGEWLAAVNVGAMQLTVRASGMWAPYQQVLIADVTGDGLDDLVVYDPATGTVSITSLTASGEATERLRTWPAHAQLQAGDFNGDGRADVFGYDAATGRAFLALRGTADFVVTEAAVGAGSTVTVARLTNTGRSDLVFYDPKSGTARVGLSDGRGAFTYQSRTWTPGLTLHAADLTGAGHDDLFGYSRESGAWMTATLTKRDLSEITGQWSAGWQIATGDLDGDHRADLVLYDPLTGFGYRAHTVAPGVFQYSPEVWAPGGTLIGRQ